MCSLSKEQSKLSRETIQKVCFFFSRMMPLFQFRLLPSIKHPTAKLLNQALHSQALATACGALVLCIQYIYTIDIGTLTNFLQINIKFDDNVKIIHKAIRSVTTSPYWTRFNPLVHRYSF